MFLDPQMNLKIMVNVVSREVVSRIFRPLFSGRLLVVSGNLSSQQQHSDLAIPIEIAFGPQGVPAMRRWASRTKHQRAVAIGKGTDDARPSSYPPHEALQKIIGLYPSPCCYFLCSSIRQPRFWAGDSRNGPGANKKKSDPTDQIG